MIQGHEDAMRAALLDWYERQGRDLPWRVRPQGRSAGSRNDPYRVWLSEIMLQQTTVPHAAPYFLAFTERWPSVADLAKAPRDDVMAAWAGLGYYARARNMHACAGVVADQYGGVFPSDPAELKSLPGVGDYTAAAIAAIAFDQPASVVDGNVERVISRLHAIDTPLPAAKKQIKALAAELADPSRPGDYAQAIMDLGATICTPRSPACGLCPWREQCAARRLGEMERFPVKAAKKARPVREGRAWLVRRDDLVWLRRRPDDGLLGGMLEPPSSGWDESADWSPPFKADWTDHGEVRHVFTHFEARLTVRSGDAPPGWEPDEGGWTRRDEIDKAGLPSLMQKVVRLGLADR